MIYLYHVLSKDYHELKSQLTLGRTSGDLIFSSDFNMSGKHAQFNLEFEGGQPRVYVKDLGSKNLIKVNRISMAKDEQVKVGIPCLVEIGSHDFILTDANPMKPELLRKMLGLLQVQMNSN